MFQIGKLYGKLIIKLTVEDIKGDKMKTDISNKIDTNQENTKKEFIKQSFDNCSDHIITIKECFDQTNKRKSYPFSELMEKTNFKIYLKNKMKSIFRKFNFCNDSASQENKECN